MRFVLGREIQKLNFKEENIMEFLRNLDAETLQVELLTFLESEDDVEITSLGEFEELFIDFIKEDLSRANG